MSTSWLIFLSLLAFTAQVSFGFPIKSSINDDSSPKLLKNSREDEIVRDIKYALFTSDNPHTPEYLTLGDEDALFASSFNASLPVKVIVHGYNGGLQDEINTALRPVLLQELDVNVIVVDWSVPASGDSVEVFPRVPVVARFVAEFLSWLHPHIEAPSPALHLIGFSLGGQMVGMVARHCDFTVEHITSLDPANRRWETEAWLNPSDANYVEVIHTSVGIIGLMEPIGHADFYPNKGSSMSGCGNDIVCDHLRAVYYYTESIDHEGFAAIRCSNLEELLADRCANTGQSYMGGSNPKDASGIYYLETNAESPYHQG